MRRNKLITFKVTKYVRDEMDTLVKKGIRTSRSELIREAIEHFLETENWDEGN